MTVLRSVIKDSSLKFRSSPHFHPHFASILPTLSPSLAKQHAFVHYIIAQRGAGQERETHTEIFQKTFIYIFKFVYNLLKINAF